MITYYYDSPIYIIFFYHKILYGRFAKTKNILIGIGGTKVEGHVRHSQNSGHIGHHHNRPKRANDPSMTMSL